MRVYVPLMKYLPRPAASPFTKTWESLFLEAYSSHSLASWQACFMFPKAVLLAPARMGQKVKKKNGSMATKILERIERWKTEREALWAEVLARAAGRKNELSMSSDRKSLPAVAPEKKSVEKAAVAALREGDVSKALRILNAAPLRRLGRRCPS